MHNLHLKQIALLFGLMLQSVLCIGYNCFAFDNQSNIVIHVAQAQGEPKGDAIQATINGHVLSVVFTENLGQVAIDISTAAGTSVDYSSLTTPNGVNFYIPNTGSYVVTFTLPNGDEYYGEFEVTD